MSNNAHELSNRLLNALDNNYNVVDMQAVNEIISILEKFNITKELLETTRLGKHVNELRRKTTDPTLARRAKVLVKRWRDLVIPTVASPGHTGSNRSSAERQVRRLGGTPLTSPALSRVVSPAVNSPRPPSRPAWGGYESDSQDVILVDDDPPAPAPMPLVPPPAVHKPLTPPVKRPTSPVAVNDEKKAKRDKKPKKRRGHSRAGSGTEATGAPPPPAPPGPPAAAPAPGAQWGARNGSAERRRNGYRREKVDPYAALVNKLPPAGAKKVKTTKELLEEIQSRGSAPAPASPPRDDAASPDVMLIEPAPSTVKVESPLRNGAPTPPPTSPHVPLEDEREYFECTCGDEPEPHCPAAPQTAVRPHHVTALHNALLPGVNGTRAPLYPHKFAVRPARHPDEPALFASVVPLYNYSDYADDYTAKNMYKVPICTHIPLSTFAPAPPSPAPPPSPPPPRPYPLEPEPVPSPERMDEDDEKCLEVKEERPPIKLEPIKIEPEVVGAPPLPGGERLKPPLLSPGDEPEPSPAGPAPPPPPPKLFASESPEHRTVEKTKEPLRPDLTGQQLFDECRRVIDSIPYDYSQLRAAPELTLPVGLHDEEHAAALVEGVLEADDTSRDELGRPPRPARFAEWHECARLGSLVALPYVVID
ncbi:hypothetical protein ABMA27_010763 [Loxostege sticticalis]|uniref:Mediator of RNA polymerase II transcription subunit 26 n=1 Tax=Loxostege sticticalis TaxID=481309 RepID=A0ABR3H4B2_LOXSC